MIKMLRHMKIYRQAFIVLAIIVLVLIWQFQHTSEHTEQTYDTRVNDDTPLNDIEVFDNILTASIQPKDGNDFFMLDTREETEKVTLNARVACAVESTALAHPHLKLFFTFSSRERLQNITKDYIYDIIHSYKNVHFKYLDLKEIAAGSPLEGFVEKNRLKESRFKIAHTSDILRLLILWKFGGTYLDTDIITMKPMDKLPPNYAGKSLDKITSAVIRFSPPLGKSLSESFMKTLGDTYDGNIYIAAGPRVLTETVKRLCHVDKISDIKVTECEGFHILDEDVLYRIPWTERMLLMTEEFADEVMKNVSKSHLIHFNNSGVRNVTLNITSNAPYVQLARKFCPKVFEKCGETF